MTGHGRAQQHQRAGKRHAPAIADMGLRQDSRHHAECAAGNATPLIDAAWYNSQPRSASTSTTVAVSIDRCARNQAGRAGADLGLRVLGEPRAEQRRTDGKRKRDIHERGHGDLPDPQSVDVHLTMNAKLP